MRVQFIIAFFILVLPMAHSARGLGVNVYTQYVKYEYKPAHRMNIKVTGDTQRFRDQSKKIAIDRVTPYLERFRDLVDFFNKKGLKIAEFNPNLESSFYTKNHELLSKSVIYPRNIVFKLDNKKLNSIELLTFTLSSKPEVENLVNLEKSITRLMDLDLKVKKSKKVFSKAEQEMLRKIRNKSIEFQKYKTYYGIRIRQDVLVEASYYSKLKSTYEQKFANILKNFQYYFFKSRDIDLAIRSKVLINVEKFIEDNFKNLNEPFESIKEDKKLLKIEKYDDSFQITFIFAKSAEFKSLNTTLNELINKSIK